MGAGCSVDRWGLVAEGAVPSAVVVVRPQRGPQDSQTTWINQLGSGHILFEPQHDVFQTLATFFADSSNVELVNTAAGSSPGKATMYISIPVILPRS
jgi:hypothetical protein